MLARVETADLWHSVVIRSSGDGHNIFGTIPGDIRPLDFEIVEFQLKLANIVTDDINGCRASLSCRGRAWIVFVDKTGAIPSDC